ncbi:MAG TPA: DUF2752 domain-containing protein [Pirellulales bacterium]|nr:DUF2752 domain-containing protein [Pirellulales bacterium]
MLAIAVFVIFMSFVLDVRGPEEQVAVTAFPNCPLPSLCLSQSLFHVSCPGCGLTRSFIYLAHGDLQSSLRMHRVGWLMALAVLLQIPYRIASLVLPGREVLGLMFPKIFGNVLITLLIGNWLFNLVVGYL